MTEGIFIILSLKVIIQIREKALKKYSYSDGKWTGPVTLFEGYAAPALSVTGDSMYLETNFETYISVKKWLWLDQTKKDFNRTRFSTLFSGYQEWKLLYFVKIRKRRWIKSTGAEL